MKCSYAGIGSRAFVSVVKNLGGKENTDHCFRFIWMRLIKKQLLVKENSRSEGWGRRVLMVDRGFV